MPRSPPLVLPATLVAVGVYALIGCIPIPGNLKRPRPEESIGKPHSGKPIRLGESKFLRVTEILGAPAMASRDASLAVYAYELNGWTTIADKCFGGNDR